MNKDLNQKLYIIDAASPFFTGQKQKVINWSKIPYHHLEKKGRPPKRIYKDIFKNFKIFINKIRELGYNAVSIDDLCHITSFDFYPDKLKKKIGLYKKRFSRFFLYAKKEKIKIFINSDIFFFNTHIKNYTKNNSNKILKLLLFSVESVFSEFPEISGLIFRIGESDGVDVKSDFASKIILKTSKQTNHYIKSMLPVFEKYNKLCIFRTWSVGGFKIGDIMWNKKTFLKTFDGINSRNFIISMKYGEADFFRYLELNTLFFENKCRKIIELQARREYEGFGEYPSFVGWYYKNFFDKLKDTETFFGIHVWCQTGGWSGFKNFTFMKKTSFWNELNTAVIINIFRRKYSVKKSIAFFYRGKDIKNFIRLLKLTDIIINDILYDPFFAGKKLYFNKSRIPPVLHVFWDNITITNAVIEFYNCFNLSGNESVKKAFKALDRFDEIKKISKDLEIEVNYRFYFETFRIIAYTRMLIYSKNKIKIYKDLKKMIKRYRINFPKGYKIYLSINKRFKNRFLRNVIKLFIRKENDMRFIEKLFFNKFTSKIIIVIYKLLKKNFPDFSDNQAMPLETFFK